MLRAIQILGSSSSGFVSHRLKPHGNCALSLVPSSAKPSPLSPCPPRRTAKNVSSMKGRCFRAFPACCTRSESNPDVTSPSSSPTLKSTVLNRVISGTGNVINLMEMEMGFSTVKYFDLCWDCGGQY
ncbi:hypothetical protein RHMOL_Rhmol04G0132600 [Rhododendron molle]|uniref:Uncharacterized protein n=1 Tax=Rhododendron molle TaxID=49168 RepID=A0ACC0P178_RHOML|nr:hypothetical protein RHMOL_Rhmol04G0132600 [Rhododendron molle]